MFFSGWDSVPAKHGTTPEYSGGSLSSVRLPSMLEHSLRLVLSQGILSDHLPPFRFAGERITDVSLSPLVFPREGGIGPLLIPSRAQCPLSFVRLTGFNYNSLCNGFHSRICSTPQRQSMEIGMKILNPLL